MQLNPTQKHSSHNPSQFKNKQVTADNGNQSRQKKYNRKSKDDSSKMETN